MMTRAILALTVAAATAACALPTGEQRPDGARYGASGPSSADAETPASVAAAAPTALGPFRDSLGLPGPEVW